MAKAMQAADLPVTAIDIPELALRNIAELLPEDVGGVAMLYLDAGQGEGGEDVWITVRSSHAGGAVSAVGALI